MTSNPHPLPTDITVFERGWLSSNNILLCGDQATALVDSGYGSHAPQTLALVREWQLSPGLELPVYQIPR